MRARNSYNGQKWNSKKRGIPFQLTFDEWYLWWLQHGVDKDQPQPKKSAVTLCMCRKGDSGPYALNNIYCDTVSNNVKFQRTHHNPGGNPGQAIMTPNGIFPSRAAAAEFYQIRATSLGNRMTRYPDQYYYI